MNIFYIFGASKKGKDFFELFNKYNSSDDTIGGFIDNDDSKQGEFIEGKEIISLDKYLKVQGNKKIIIASMYFEEIKNQLISKLLTTDEFMLDYDYFCNNVKLSKEDIESAINFSRDEDLILTLPHGNILGGLEKWTRDIYFKSQNYQKKPILLSFESDMEKYDCVNEFNEIILERHSNMTVTIKNTCLKILNFKKATVILNNSIETLLALKVLKRYGISKKFKIISIVHIDHKEILNYNILEDELISEFICVSQEIKEKLVALLPHRESNIKVAISPISNSYILSQPKKYSLGDEPIRLGYASRLESHQKRSLDVFKLCEILDGKEVKYSLEVVGDGSLAEDFYRNEVVEYKGRIASEEIREFWSDKDIHLSFSDAEGTSLAMLEAMSQGVIPIVTNVSGVKLFVDESCGKIVDVADIKAMANYICELSKDKGALPQMGELCINKIKEHCNEKKYYDNIFQLCQ